MLPYWASNVSSSASKAVAAHMCCHARHRFIFLADFVLREDDLGAQFHRLLPHYHPGEDAIPVKENRAKALWTLRLPHAA